PRPGCREHFRRAPGSASSTGRPPPLRVCREDGCWDQRESGLSWTASWTLARGLRAAKEKSHRARARYGTGADRENSRRSSFAPRVEFGFFLALALLGRVGAGRFGLIGSRQRSIDLFAPGQQPIVQVAGLVGHRGGQIVLLADIVAEVVKLKV